MSDQEQINRNISKAMQILDKHKDWTNEANKELMDYAYNSVKGKSKDQSATKILKDELKKILIKWKGGIGTRGDVDYESFKRLIKALGDKGDPNAVEILIKALFEVEIGICKISNLGQHPKYLNQCNKIILNGLYKITGRKKFFFSSDTSNAWKKWWKKNKEEIFKKKFGDSYYLHKQNSSEETKVSCSRWGCNALILQSTAERTGGLCMPCYKK